jgi:hypothetical protein
MMAPRRREALIASVEATQDHIPDLLPHCWRRSSVDNEQRIEQSAGAFKEIGAERRRPQRRTAG